MGNPVTLQYPFVGGLDQKDAALYLDPQSAVADITNGNLGAHVGQVEKRYGMVADMSVATALLLNASAIAQAYLTPNTNQTALSGFGDVVFQQAFAWTAKAGTLGFVGAMPSCSVVRRPLPVIGPTVPIILDGVPSKLGTVRAAAWVTQTGAGAYLLNAALLDPATGAALLELPAVAQNANTALTLVALLNLNGLICIFYAAYDTVAGAHLYCYTLDATQQNMVWTTRAGATLALENAPGCALDVAPFNGDPAHGYVVCYLPATVTNQLSWAYFSGFANTKNGTLAAGTFPGDNPIYIQADYGTDVAIFHSDGAAGAHNDRVYWNFFSGDGNFTALANGNATYASFNPVAGGVTGGQLAGLCRMATMYPNKNGLVINAPVSQLYVAFCGTDSTYQGSGGPYMPVAFAALVNRDAGNVVTAPVYSFAYPQGFQPIGKPAQVTDGLQSAAAPYVHVAQPCMLLLDNQPRIVASLITRTLQATLYMLDVRFGPSVASLSVNVSATCAPRQCDTFLAHLNNVFQGVDGAGGSVLNTHLPPSVAADGVTVLVPTIVAATGMAGALTDIVAHWLGVFSFAAPSTPTVVRINQTPQMSGALPCRLISAPQDNATSTPVAPKLLEHGFIHYPEFCFTNIIGGGSITGTYAYAVVYGRQDGNGAIERSAPDVLNGTAALVNQKAEVYFPNLAWWASQDQTSGAAVSLADPEAYFVEIYRTVNNGATYYCVARLYPKDFAATNTPTMSKYVDDPAVSTDAIISSAEILYTTGGFLDNVNPPGSSLHLAHRGRYAVVDDTQRQVWFTQQETVGEVLGFNEALISPFVEGGDITALGSMDDKLVVFKAQSIWIQYGDGPAANGQGSDWTIPQLVPSDVGCTSAASVVLIPDGLLFLSAAGFHLLGRGLDVQYLGKAVQDTVSAFPTCISAAVVPQAKQARFCMQAQGGGQVVLVYDYFLKQWSKHTYSYLDAAIAQLLLVGGQYAILTTKGSRYIEAQPTVAAPFLDVDLAGAPHFVPTSAKSPPFRVSGVQGYQMVRNLKLYGVPFDGAGLQVQLFANEGSAPIKTATWTAAMLQGNPRVTVRVPAAYAKCRSIQALVTDADDPTKVTGQGIGFGAIALEMEQIGDTYRRVPARLKA